MKATVARMMSIGIMIFLIAFLCSMRIYPAWDLSAEVSAFDIGIFALSVSIFLQSLPGLIYNDCLFLQQKKDWRDFWSGDVLEYFYRSDQQREAWKLARGRCILYFLSCVLSVGLLIAYINIRH